MNPFIKHIGGNLSLNKLPFIEQHHMVKIKGQELKLGESTIDQSINYIGFTDDLISLLTSNKLSQSQLVFLFILMKNVRKDNAKVYLEVRKISKEMNLSEQSIRSFIIHFKSIGIISKVTGRGSASQYYVNPYLIFRGNRIDYMLDINPNLVSQVSAFKSFK